MELHAEKAVHTVVDALAVDVGIADSLVDVEKKHYFVVVVVELYTASYNQLVCYNKVEKAPNPKSEPNKESISQTISLTSLLLMAVPTT